MEADKITDRVFWQRYWDKFQPYQIRAVLFDDLFVRFPPGKRSFIEIGGFPGTYAIYFKKNKDYDVTILDYYIDRKIINRMEEVNNLEKGTIKLIERDFLESEMDKQYDIVFSAGFIEHFNDPERIIRQHYDMLKKDGLLFIALPNFLGLNGLVQKFFHRENYRAHNLKIMELTRLKKLFGKLVLSNLEIFYYGRPCLWLEESANASKLVRVLITMGTKIISRINMRNRLLSPYIVIMANK